MEKNHKSKNIRIFIKNSKEFKEIIDRLKRDGLLGEVTKLGYNMLKDS